MPETQGSRQTGEIQLFTPKAFRPSPHVRPHLGFRDHNVGVTEQRRGREWWRGSSVIILTVDLWKAYALEDSVRFCFLIFSTRVVLLILRSFAAFVLTQLLFSKASTIILFS